MLIIFASELCPYKYIHFYTAQLSPSWIGIKYLGYSTPFNNIQSITKSIFDTSKPVNDSLHAKNEFYYKAVTMVMNE